MRLLTGSVYISKCHAVLGLAVSLWLSDPMELRGTLWKRQNITKLAQYPTPKVQGPRVDPGPINPGEAH